MDATRPIVFLIDDDESELKSIKRLLNSARYDTEVFKSASDFLARAAHAGPACVIVAVHIPRLNGIDLQEALIQLRREEQLVFISGNGNVRMCARAMQAGAVDFLQKPLEPGELLRSVERALDRSVEQRRQACDKVEAIRLLALLTPREFAVMQLVIIGLLNKEIADELGMAEKTVKVHRGRVMQKLGVRSVPEVIRLVQNAQDGPVHQTRDLQQQPVAIDTPLYRRTEREALGSATH